MRRAVDKVHQQVFRGERLGSAHFQAARKHYLVNAAGVDGGKPVVYSALPCLARIKSQRVVDAAARARARGKRQAREALHTAGVHRAKRVDLQKRSALVFDKHHFGKHEVQAGKRLEQLVGRRRVVRVEAVEREEHRLFARRSGKLAFRVVKRGQCNAAAQAHEANGAVFAVVNELVREAFLQQAEHIDDIDVKRLSEREYPGHSPSPSIRNG